ncbi:hypothetical protein CspHIS471_0410690 [Cutaneotrichosporon sp. HIS471]|nr:hypothetical protein CspHIS471_0410690 [Cutaneotrichosporon sp. HIS471]
MILISLLLALPAVLGSGITPASKYVLGARSPDLQARQVIELCGGSMIFERCGGPWCAPEGMFCCGLITQVNSAVQDPSAIASMLTRSDIMSILTGSFTGMPTGFPTGKPGMPSLPAGGAVRSYLWNRRLWRLPICSTGNSGTSGNSGSGGGKSNPRVLGMNGMKRRTIDLDLEVELINAWLTEIACTVELVSKSTNEAGATIKFEIGRDVAGFALSHSCGAEANLSISQSLSGSAVGIVQDTNVSLDATIPNLPPSNKTAPAGEVINWNCWVSYVFKRDVSYGQFEETISLIYELPPAQPLGGVGGSSDGNAGGNSAPANGTGSGAGSSAGSGTGSGAGNGGASGGGWGLNSGGNWGRINGITLYSDENELAKVIVGDKLVIERDPSVNASSGNQTGSGAPGASATSPSGASTLAMPVALAALVAAVALLV